MREALQIRLDEIDAKIAASTDRAGRARPGAEGRLALLKAARECVVQADVAADHLEGMQAIAEQTRTNIAEALENMGAIREQLQAIQDAQTGEAQPPATEGPVEGQDDAGSGT